MSSYYNKKKSKIKQVYSPSIPSAPMPNYYQQKGRVIQQSPRVMVDPPTKMISYDDLKKMYNQLIRYKFPMPFYQQNFTFQFQTTLQNFLLKYPSTTMTPERFDDFCQDVISQTNPALFGSKIYRFRLMGFQLANLTGATIQGNWQFKIQWITNMLSDPLDIVHTDYNMDLPNNYISPICNVTTYRPTDPDNNICDLYLQRLTNTSARPITDINIIVSNATINLFLPRVPLIVTRIGENNLYYSEIKYTHVQGTRTPDMNVFLYVDAEPV